MFLCACGAPFAEEPAGTAPVALCPQALHPGEPRSGEPSAQLAHGIATEGAIRAAGS